MSAQNNRRSAGDFAPLVLIPFDRAEAMSIDEAAEMAGVSASTVRTWCATFHVGRRLAGGPWRVSKPALQMLMDGDRFSLERYLSGHRDGRVADYFGRFGIATPY